MTSWSKLSYQDLTFEVIKLYVDSEEIPHSELRGRTL